MFSKFVNILRIAQKVLIVILSIIVGVLETINKHMRQGEAQASA